MRGRQISEKSNEVDSTAASSGRRRESEAPDVAGRELDPVARALQAVPPSAEAQASALNRSTGGRPSRAAGAVLQMQRHYGNRHVQRVLAMARQDTGNPVVTPEVESNINRQRGGGRVLDSGLRAQMEPAFRADFSGVRVHTDAKADSLNQALSARAFTTGRDIFFRQGEYNPGSSQGQELLAHELTHVVQQGGGPVQGKLTVSQPGDTLEREADSLAQAVMQGVQRQPEEEEEELQAKLASSKVERQTMEEEDKQESIQTKAQGSGVQRQTEEDEEMLLGKWSRGQAPVQRKGNGGVAGNSSSDIHARASRMISRNCSAGSPLIQRATDRDTDGDDWLSLTIPDGTYVLEAANIPADGGWDLTFGSRVRVYGTASQYTPRQIYGLNADPHRIDNAAGGDFRIVPGWAMESAAGEGSAKIQAFRHNRVLSDERVMEAYLRFDTVPMISINGETTYVGGTVYDMRRANHQYFNLAEGGSAGQQMTYSRSITNGYTLSRGSSVSNTLSSSVSSKIGADLKVISAEVGSEISASRTVTNSIQESISTSMSESTSVSYSGSAEGPGRFVIIPTAQVWRTPVTVNTFDSTGKRTGARADNVYTVIFNNIPTVLRVADDGRTILDLDGTPLPNQER